MTTVRNGDTTGPAPIAQATLATLTDAVNSTTLEGPSGNEPPRHSGKGTAITLGILAVVPIIVIPIVVSRGSQTSPTTPSKQCQPGTAICG